MLEPKSHSLTSERFLINQESILTHKNGIFIDWVRQPLWRDLRDYWVNMWYKSACLRRVFFLVLSSYVFQVNELKTKKHWHKTFQCTVQQAATQALTNLFGKHPWISSPCTKLTFFFLNWNTPPLFTSSSFATFLRPVLFVFTGSHFTVMSLCVFLFFWEQTMKPIIFMIKLFSVC